MPKRAKKAVPERTSTNRLKPKQSPEAEGAELMVEGFLMNAATAVAYSRNLGALDLAECMAALIAETESATRQYGRPGGDARGTSGHAKRDVHPARVSVV